MASVSARFKAEGGAGFALGEAVAGASSEVLDSTLGGVGVAIGAVAGAASVAVVFVSAGAGQAPDASRVFISTALVERGSLLLCGRDPEPACCGVLCGAVGAWSAGEAMVGWSFAWPTSLAM